MLTVELLAQSPVLAALTEEQRNAIVELSRNDENAVIGKRIGELHGQYDKDILDVTGVSKKDGEKSYDYMKRVLGDYKGKVESSKGTKAELDEANKKIAELQGKIEKGAVDETLRTELKDAKTRASQLQEQLKAKETEFTTMKAKHETEMRDTHLNYAFQAATSGLKFKPGVTETVQKVLLQSAKAEILAKGTPDFINGTQLVFRDKEGNVLNNPANNLNPYTLKELVMESSIKDMIDTGKQLPGGGTGPTGTPGAQSVGVDLSGVKNQVEATDIIEKHLLASGLTRDSKEFSEQMTSLFKENDVAKLPIR